MKKKYQRKEFLKISLLANIGLYVKPFVLNAVAEPVVTAINASELQSGENVFYYQRGDKEYDDLRRGFNKRFDKYPLIIALCKNVQGIVEAIQYAKTKNLPVAVKSGGHSMEGFSSNDAGLVINLSLLNKVEWTNNETIQVGPGCTLSKLYDVLLLKGKIIPGGSCGNVGIGGLTLGGGYGLLSRKYGLTCDSLLEVTMVDGNGIIRNSNDDKDLLWACKGGGNGNFGVIAEMKFKVHPSPDALQIIRFRSVKINTDRAKTILKKWFLATTNLPASCFSSYILNGKTVYILLTNTEKNTNEIQNVIRTISRVADNTTNTNHTNISNALKVFYGVQHPIYFKNASAGLYKSYDEIENYIDQVLEIVINTPGMIYQVNTLGGAIQNVEFESGSSFPHRAYSYFSELQTYWDDIEEGQDLMANFEKIQQIFSENGVQAQYCNYPDINFKNWDSLYYGNHYEQLRQIKNKYDPNNLIRHEQSVRNSPEVGKSVSP